MQEYWSVLLFPPPVGPCFVRTPHYDPSMLGGPAWHAHSFTELHKPLHQDKKYIYVYMCVCVCV